MKPTKMRNNLIYQATYQTKSKQLGSALSKDLHKKYGKRSVRVIEGDSVTITRGEFKGVDGKVGKISTQKSSVAIEGVKKEKTKGEKFDVYIHASNLVITSLNGEDKWRMAKLENKNPKKQPKETPKSAKVEPKETIAEPKETIAEPKETIAEPKETIAEPKETIAEPKETIAEPKETIAEPKETIAEPKETIAEPKETIAEPKETIVVEKSEKKEDES